MLQTTVIKWNITKGKANDGLGTKKKKKPRKILAVSFSPTKFPCVVLSLACTVLLRFAPSEGKAARRAGASLGGRICAGVACWGRAPLEESCPGEGNGASREV